MVGATIFGASAAADLADYPSPLFIKDGRFSGNIVVGAGAAAEDVVGAIEIGTSLQFASVKKSVSTTATEDVFEVADGYRIERSGDPLVFGSFIRDVQDTPLDESDLPTMLKDGFYDDNEGNNDNTAEYDQEIEFSTTSGQVVFTQDENEGAEVGGPYLFFDDNINAYTYTLDFQDTVDVDNSSAANVADDIEDSELEILGQSYTIIDASSNAATGNFLDELTLLAGETVIWLAKDEPITRVIDGVEHEILLVGVNSGETKCSLQIDDAVQIVDVGQTRTVNGVEVGVSDAIHSDTGLDNCKVNIGATKVRIKTGDELKINDRDLDNSEGNMRMTNAAVWDGLNFSVQPDDETYIAPGEEWIDPVFSAFKLTFGGMDAKEQEYIHVSASGDDATITFPNLDGKEVELEYTIDGSENIIAGDGTGIDERIYFEGDTCDFSGATNAADCEGARFLVITSGGEAHLMEIDDIKTNGDDEIDIKDLTYGTENDAETFDFDALGANVIQLGSGAGAITLTIVNASGGASAGTVSQINFSSIDSSSSGAKTDGEHFISFNSPVNAVSATIFTVTEDTDDGIGGLAFSVNLTYDTTEDEMETRAPLATSGSFNATAVDFDEDNDDDQWYVSRWGTRVLFDAEDQKELEIWLPKGYTEGLIYVSEVGAVATQGQSVSVTELQPIEVGAAKLDNEISDVEAQNLIVVGGPCANTAAAALMGNPADCAEGFEQGAAMIKLMEHSNGNVALLVAGFSALDTRRAARVLANYKDYSSNLVGSEVVVRGTTLSDVRFESASTA